MVKLPRAEPWYYRGAVAYRGGGVWVVQTPPEFRSFDKADPNSQLRGKYIRNNLTRIRLSLIFWVVAWKALPASYDPHSSIFFFQGMTWPKHKLPKIKKILPYEMKFLVPNYSCLQNPWLGGYRPQIPILSLLCPQLNLLNPPRKKILVTPLQGSKGLWELSGWLRIGRLDFCFSTSLLHLIN